MYKANCYHMRYRGIPYSPTTHPAANLLQIAGGDTGCDGGGLRPRFAAARLPELMHARREVGARGQQR